MIKFFRKIRYDLMEKNKTSKYLKYAIGEIILVVIGILIALQINNWNEEQKLRKEEAKLIQSFTNEIESNLIILETEIKNNQTIIQLSTKFLKANDDEQKNKIPVAYLLSALGYNSNKTEKSILDEILNTNTRTLISNDSLLIQLKSLKSAFEYNGKTQYYVEEFWNTKVVSYINDKNLGIYLTSFKKEQSQQKIFEVDQFFFSLLGFMNGSQEALLLSRQNLKEELEKTKTFIEKNYD